MLHPCSVRTVPSPGDAACEAQLCAQRHPPDLPLETVADLGLCGLRVRLKGHGWQRQSQHDSKLTCSVVILRLEVHITFGKTSNLPENKVPAPLEGAGFSGQQLLAGESFVIIESSGFVLPTPVQAWR